MPEARKNRNRKLLELDQQLAYELSAFSDNVNALTEAPEQKQYDRFCGHLAYIQEMLNDASVLIRDLQLERSDPDFLELLKAKDHIREHFIEYSRLRGYFYQNYRVEDEREQALERTLDPEGPRTDSENSLSQDDNGELSPEEDFLQEQEALAEAAILAAEEEAEVAEKKKAKRKKEQRRIEEVQRRRRQEEQEAEEAAREKQARAAHQMQIDEQEEALRTQADLASLAGIELLDEERNQENLQNAKQIDPEQPPESSFSEHTPDLLRQTADRAQYDSTRLRDRAFEEQEKPPLSHNEDLFSPEPQASAKKGQTETLHEVQSETQVFRENGGIDRDEEAIQRARWEEAKRLGIDQNPDKAISEYELARERASQQEEAIRREQVSQEYREQENTAMQRLRERQEANEQYTRLGKAHVDFSHDLSGSQEADGKTSEIESQDVPPIVQQGTQTEIKATGQNTADSRADSRTDSRSDTPDQTDSFEQHEKQDVEQDTPEVPDTKVHWSRDIHQVLDNEQQEVHKVEGTAPGSYESPSHVDDRLEEDFSERERVRRRQEQFSLYMRQDPSSDSDSLTSGVRNLRRDDETDIVSSGSKSVPHAGDLLRSDIAGEGFHAQQSGSNGAPTETQNIGTGKVSPVSPLKPSMEQKESVQNNTSHVTEKDSEIHDDIQKDADMSGQDTPETASTVFPLRREENVDNTPSDRQAVPPIDDRFRPDQSAGTSDTLKTVPRAPHSEVQDVVADQDIPVERPGPSDSYRDSRPDPMSIPIRDDSKIKNNARKDIKGSGTDVIGTSSSASAERKDGTDDKAPSGHKPLPHSGDRLRSDTSNEALSTPKWERLGTPFKTERTRKEQDTVIYRSTPFGVREESSQSSLAHPSQSNVEIYAKIKKGMEKSSADAPVTLSSAYVSSMVWNVHMARVEYQAKKDTAEALHAVQHYQRQRQALESLKADVRAGRIKVEQPKGSDEKPSEKAETPKASPYSTQFRYTPFGVIGSNLGPNGEVTGSFRINSKAVRDNFRYTAEQPLKVSPKYDAAIQERLQKATSALDAALQLKTQLPPKISLDMHNELCLAQDAYAAFHQAKQMGVVVVSADSTLDRPDFREWQQRHRANIFGSTMSSNASTASKSKKEDVEEHSASLLSKKSRLRYEHFYSRYARSLAHKTSSYAWSASAMFSRNLYMLVQMGDDNAIRTFESGRYYAVTAAKLTNAVMHLHVVTPNKVVRQASKQELHRFARYVNKDNKTLSKEISDKKRMGRESKKVIRGLKAERDAVDQQIKNYVFPGSVLSKDEQLHLKQLGQKQRLIAEQLRKKQAAHLSLNHDLRREVAYFKLRKQNAEEARILKELREKHGYFISRRKLRQDIADTQAAASKKLVKKYGNYITSFSDKSVKREIKSLKEQAKKLKTQIKALQAKGSALSQAQRQTLKQMMDKHKSISQQLRLLIGLDKDRAAINAELALKGKLLNQMYANANAFTNALFAMKRIVLRPLREGTEYGVQGFGAGMSILANRQLHRMMKKVFKASIRYVPATAAFLVTGDAHAATAAVTYAERATKMAVFKSKEVVRKTTKKAAKIAVQGSKKAVSAITPQPVKRGVHYVSDITKSIRGKFKTVSAFKQKISQNFWASKVGRSISSVNNFTRNAMQFVKSAARIAKSVIVKVVVGFALLFLLCGVIASLAGAPAGGAAGSLILSPYEGAEGKINLGPYMDILNECQAEYDKMIEETRQAYLGQYDKVTIIPAIPDNNSREILSMMAVRCSQDLDLSNAMVERYLKSIFKDSHFYTTQASEYYSCSGCKTKIVRTGHTSSCPDPCYAIHTKEVKYCPGTHQDLTISLHVLFFDEIFTADSMGNDGQTAVAGQEIGTFRITHYCACASCCGKDPSDPAYGITATGTTATADRTIAVDPNVIPLGTHVVIEGVEYVAEDVGGAIDGNRIDIYVDSHEEALAKGVKTLPVYYASYEGESVVETGEWDGWTEDNVFWCKTIYNMDWAELYTGIPNVTDVVGNESNLDGVTFIDGDRPGNQAIVDIAMSQLGQQGGQPYWSWYGFDSRVEWCATFVSWCANQNGVLGTSIPKFASCRYQGVPWFQEHGQWAAGHDIVPVAGDIIFFDWEGDGVPNHVGIVVGTDGDKVYTVEGNSGDVVRTKAYNLNSNLIFGYGLPNY